VYVAILLLLVRPGISAVLKTRWTPVVLNVIKERQQAANSREKGDTQGRSKPLLFQQILGLTPGRPFTFNIDKWRALVSSGLFHNLTANTVNTPDGVYLNVTGYESSSIMISPEITVTTSLENPEIVGGVCILACLLHASMVVLTPVRTIRVCNR
jgi:hypothetical protein